MVDVTFSVPTFSVPTFSVPTFSVPTFSVSTFSVSTFSVSELRPHFFEKVDVTFSAFHDCQTMVDVTFSVPRSPSLQRLRFELARLPIQSSLRHQYIRQMKRGRA